MRAHTTAKLFIEIVALLHIALFIYAAISKLLDYENFIIQLGQSPLLSAFTGTISWGIPAIEIIIALGLAIPPLRPKALVASFILMVMFTAYIFTVLHFSNYVPCGCGGILEDMRWEDHMLFNLAFVLLAAAAIIIHYYPDSQRRFSWQAISTPAAILLVSSVVGISTVTAAHLASAEIIHRHNSFIRRFPNNPDKVGEADLKYNSYYFSGFEKGVLYLGNYTAPSLIKTIDSTLQRQNSITITYPDSIPAYKSLNIQVLHDKFYIVDGTVPMVLKGNMKDGKARISWRGTKQFSQAKVVDSMSVIFRAFGKENTTTLGKLHMGSPDVTLKDGLIKKQIDGIFDTDGLLQYDAASGTMVYNYYYRNQYIVTDTDLTLKRMGSTIDTISKAVLKVAHVKARGETKLAAPPLIVNRAACTDSGLLYVNSALMGRYESEAMWKQAAVIDVYEMHTGRYISSFYVYDINGKRLRSFMVKGDHLYALIGSTLVAYHLYDGLLKEALE